MAKRVIQLYDKYKSTTKVYPLIVGECLTDDAKLAIKGIADDEINENVPDIIANVELAGTEAELTSLQIGDTKYKIGGGKQLYQHNITCKSDTGIRLCFKIINDSNVSFGTLWTNETDIRNWLQSKGFTDNERMYECNGSAGVSSSSYIFTGMYYDIDQLQNKRLKTYITKPDGTYTDYTISNISQINDTVITL